MSRSHILLTSAAACVALLGVACSNSLSPYGDLQGTWAQQESLPGFSLVITLSQSGDVVAGSGTYAGEAGPSGAVTVRGDVHAPIDRGAGATTISLFLTFTQSLPSSGGVEMKSFAGRLLDASHMTGVLAADTAGAITLPVTFVR
jgi:hypothetical protein